VNRAMILFPILAACVAFPGAAAADELFGGLYVHDVKTPLDKSGIERGADMLIGWRGDRIGRTPLQPYVFGALNTEGETSYAGVGLSARFGDRIFVRPGLGFVVHTGSAANHFRNDKIAFGSRLLFEPELGVGARLNQRLSLEASWVHMSHAQLFGRENPGIDNFGMRLTLGL
jgi:lipid A 3-O-deacylase